MRTENRVEARTGSLRLDPNADDLIPIEQSREVHDRVASNHDPGNAPSTTFRTRRDAAGRSPPSGRRGGRFRPDGRTTPAAPHGGSRRPGTGSWTATPGALKVSARRAHLGFGAVAASADAGQRTRFLRFAPRFASSRPAGTTRLPVGPSWEHPPGKTAKPQGPFVTDRDREVEFRSMSLYKHDEIGSDVAVDHEVHGLHGPLPGTRRSWSRRSSRGRDPVDVAILGHPPRDGARIEYEPWRPGFGQRGEKVAFSECRLSGRRNLGYDPAQGRSAACNEHDGTCEAERKPPGLHPTVGPFARRPVRARVPFLFTTQRRRR